MDIRSWSNVCVWAVASIASLYRCWTKQSTTERAENKMQIRRVVDTAGSWDGSWR